MENEQASAASMAATDGDTDVPLDKTDRTNTTETAVWRARCNTWWNSPEQIDDHVKGKNARITQCVH
eukprot:6310977-Lingulodinium_polyedra.AAC.1